MTEGLELQGAVDVVARAAALAGDRVLARISADSAVLVAVANGREIAIADNSGLQVRLSRADAANADGQGRFDGRIEEVGSDADVLLCLDLISVHYDAVERKGLVLLAKAVRHACGSARSRGEPGIEDVVEALIDDPSRIPGFVNAFNVDLPQIPGARLSDIDRDIDPAACVRVLHELVDRIKAVDRIGQVDSFGEVPLPVQSALGEYTRAAAVSLGTYADQLRVGVREVLVALDPSLEFRSISADVLG